MDLGNSFEVVVYHLLIRGITNFGHQYEVPMMSALVCIIAHWTRPIGGHDIRLSQVVVTSPSCYTILSFNLERILNLY